MFVIAKNVFYVIKPQILNFQTFSVTVRSMFSPYMTKPGCTLYYRF